MKLIEQKYKFPKKYIFKKITKIFELIFIYIFGISLYAFIFIVPSYYLNNIPFRKIDLLWIILIPSLGSVLGILHLYYKKTGSLIARSIVMLSIALIFLTIPLVLLIIV